MLDLKYKNYAQKFGADDEEVARSRGRLLQEQQEILEIEYQLNPAWNGSKIQLLAKRLNLGHTKVYKWCWDRKKK